MKYLVLGIAIVFAFVAGALACAFLPLGYLEDGASIGELRLSRVNLDGRPYLALTGYDSSDWLYRGDAEMVVRGDRCNIRIQWALLNHGQRSGNFAYLFDAVPTCSRITFGDRQSPL